MLNRLLTGVLVLAVCSAAFADYASDRNAAMELFRKRTFEEAQAAFMKIAEGDVTDAQKTEALEQAAECALQLKKYDEAMDLAKRVPLDANSKAAQMKILARQRKWKELVEAFKDEKIADWPPAIAGQGFQGRGLAYFSLRNGEAAQTDFTEALKYARSKFGQSDAWLNLGNTYRTLLEDDDQALDAYRKAVALQGESNSWLRYSALLQVATILREQGKFDEAHKALEIKTLPEGVWAGRVRVARGEVFLAEGKTAEAAAAFRAAAATPNIPEGYVRDWTKRAEEVPAAAEQDGTPKNIIILISDGCGYRHIEAANLYQLGTPRGQVYEEFPAQFAVSTFSLNGHGYDPEKAWQDLNYIKTGATDSAAAGTALATGKKTHDGVVGMDGEGARVKNVMERAEELGKSTGVVTSVQFAHATPACFVAHNISRGSYAAIANEMIQASEVDVIMGCGHPEFMNNAVRGYTNNTRDGYDYTYVGGEKTWQALVAETAGSAVDADHNGLMDDAWSLITDREQFKALAAGDTPKRVIGIPQVHTTLQQARGGNGKLAPFEIPPNTQIPTLAEMTSAAINVLDNNERGFVLMIEGGAVDWAAHANQSGRTIEEQIDFNKAVAAVCDWVKQNSRWEETLVIVTADHETGYLCAPAGEKGSLVPADQPLVNKGKGEVPGMAWRSGDHTNQLIPFFAKGVGSTSFASRATRLDPKLGPYLDNTDIAGVIFELLDSSTP